MTSKHELKIENFKNAIFLLETELETIKYQISQEIKLEEEETKKTQVVYQIKSKNHKKIRELVISHSLKNQSEVVDFLVDYYLGKDK